MTEFLAGGDLVTRTANDDYDLTERKCQIFIRQVFSFRGGKGEINLKIILDSQRYSVYPWSENHPSRLETFQHYVLKSRGKAWIYCVPSFSHNSFSFCRMTTTFVLLTMVCLKGYQIMPTVSRWVLIFSRYIDNLHLIYIGHSRWPCVGLWSSWHPRWWTASLPALPLTCGVWAPLLTSFSLGGNLHSGGATGKT